MNIMDLKKKEKEYERYSKFSEVLTFIFFIFAVNNFLKENFYLFAFMGMLSVISFACAMDFMKRCKKCTIQQDEILTNNNTFHLLNGINHISKSIDINELKEMCKNMQDSHKKNNVNFNNFKMNNFSPNNYSNSKNTYSKKENISTQSPKEFVINTKYSKDFETLGFKFEVPTFEELSKKYKHLSTMYHPDKCRDDVDPYIMISINEAFDKLKKEYYKRK